MRHPFFHQSDAHATAARHGAAGHEDVVLRRTAWIAGGVALFVMLLALGANALATAALLVLVAIGVKSYAENEAHLDVRASLDEAWNASLEALGENGYAFGEPTWHGATEGRVRIGDTDVRVEKMPGDSTRVRVRVGLFDRQDNRRRAALLLESVGRRVQ